MKPQLQRIEIPGDSRSLLEYLQAEPKSTLVRSSPCSPIGCQEPRHCVSRPQSPKRGPEGCCFRMASPGNRAKGKVEALEKQLAQWKERAQVWHREKQALEQRLEKQAFEPSSNAKEAGDSLIRKAKDLLILRQESRIKELSAQVTHLHAQLALSQGNSSLDRGAYACKARLEDIKTPKRRLYIRGITVPEAEIMSIPATGATTPEDLRPMDKFRPILADYQGNHCEKTAKSSESDRELVSDLCRRLREVENELILLTDALSTTQSSEISLKLKVKEMENAFRQRDIEAEEAKELKRVNEELKTYLEQEKREIDDLKEKITVILREKDQEIAEKQQNQAKFEAVSAELAEIRQVLEASESAGLEHVDVRGLARILLASVPPI